MLGAVDIFGANVILVQVAHQFSSFRLSQSNAERTECVKDDLE